MLFAILITILLTTIQILYTDGIKTTPPVSIILDGVTLKTWTDQSLWNKTRLSIVHHLNVFCKKSDNCDAEYGIANVHLLDIVQYGSSSIRLNISVDEPIAPFNLKLKNIPPAYNYTALLTNALFQTKIDLERLHGNRSLYKSTYSHQNSFHNRTSRLLFVLLGIILVAIIFGLTVFFFQRIRRHHYSQLLKSTQTYHPKQDQPLTNSPLMSTPLQ